MNPSAPCWLPSAVHFDTKNGRRHTTIMPTFDISKFLRTSGQSVDPTGSISKKNRSTYVSSLGNPFTINFINEDFVYGADTEQTNYNEDENNKDLPISPITIQNAILENENFDPISEDVIENQIDTQNTILNTLDICNSNCQTPIKLTEARESISQMPTPIKSVKHSVSPKYSPLPIESIDISSTHRIATPGIVFSMYSDCESSCLIQSSPKPIVDKPVLESLPISSPQCLKKSVFIPTNSNSLKVHSESSLITCTPIKDFADSKKNHTSAPASSFSTIKIITPIKFLATIENHKCSSETPIKSTNIEQLEVDSQNIVAESSKSCKVNYTESNSTSENIISDNMGNKDNSINENSKSQAIEPASIFSNSSNVLCASQSSSSFNSTTTITCTSSLKINQDIPQNDTDIVPATPNFPIFENSEKIVSENITEESKNDQNLPTNALSIFPNKISFLKKNNTLIRHSFNTTLIRTEPLDYVITTCRKSAKFSFISSNNIFPEFNAISESLPFMAEHFSDSNTPKQSIIADDSIEIIENQLELEDSLIINEPYQLASDNLKNDNEFLGNNSDQESVDLNCELEDVSNNVIENVDEIESITQKNDETDEITKSIVPDIESCSPNNLKETDTVQPNPLFNIHPNIFDDTTYPSNIIFENEKSFELDENEVKNLTDAFKSLANIIENSFVTIMQKYFKSQSYGLICTEIANSFQNQLLRHVALVLKKKCNILFDPSTLSPKDLSNEKNTLDEISNQNENDIINDHLSLATDLYNDIVHNWIEWKGDGEDPKGILLKNVKIDKKTKEITIMYFDNSEDMQHLKNPGIKVSQSQLKYILGMSFEYERMMETKLSNFWTNSLKIKELAIKKAKHKILENISLDKNTFKNISHKRKTEDMANEFELKISNKSNETELLDKNNNSLNNENITNAFISDSSSFISTEGTIVTEEPPMKRRSIISLVDVSKLSHLYKINDNKPIKVNQTNNINHIPMSMIESTNIATKSTIDSEFVDVNQNSLLTKGLVGMELLKDLQHKFIETLETASSEARMLVDLVDQLSRKGTSVHVQNSNAMHC